MYHCIINLIKNILIRTSGQDDEVGKCCAYLSHDHIKITTKL